MKSRFRGLLANTALVFISLFVAALALEAVLRVTGFEYHALMRKGVEGERSDEADGGTDRAIGFVTFAKFLADWKQFEFDPELFWRPRAGQYVFNEQGFRGPVWGPKAADGPLRVVAVGDSNTLGHIHGDAPHWPGFLQSYFDETELQVLNAGVYGYSSHQGLVRLKEVLALEPDYVIISFGANDGYRRGFDDRQYAERIAPFKAIQSLRIDDLLLRVLDVVAPLPGYDELTARVSPEHYKENLKEMLALCRAQGIECLLLTRAFELTSPVSVRSLKLNPLHFVRFMADYNDLTREVAAESGAALFDVAAYFDGKTKLFRDSNHFNAVGYRVMADLLSQEIKKTYTEFRGIRRALYLGYDIASFEGMHPSSWLPQWSEASLRVDLTKLTLRPRDERIVLNTRGWRKFDRPEEVNLKVRLDGEELNFLERVADDIHFALPAGIEAMRELSITIDSFTPSELSGESEDDRALGLDIVAVRLE